jgi:hypothetical protein
MSENYYYRVRGEVKGPFPREQIISLIRKKRLGRHHELSPDAVTWMRAGEIEGLFEATPSVEYAIPVAEEEGTPEVAASTTTGTSTSSSGDDGWYYARGRNTLGPITSHELRAMLATGRLNGSDRVWNQSLADWVPAEDLPQFMGSVRDEPQRVRNSNIGRTVTASASFFEILFGLSSGSSLPATTAYKYPNLARYLVISESLNRILLVLNLLGATAWYVFLVAEAITRSNALLIVGTMFLGMLALLIAYCLLWFLFVAGMAMLEFMRVVIKIEDNTYRES